MINLSPLSDQQLLLHWLAEVQRFEALYRQIGDRLDKQAALQQAHHTCPAYVGMCPRTRLISLQHSMHTELEMLLVDLEAWPLASQPAQQRLALHCRRLRRLNQRAHSSLQLAATLPT